MVWMARGLRRGVALLGRVPSLVWLVLVLLRLLRLAVLVGVWLVAGCGS